MRSLNKVTLIGNLTRDPELRYTPQGTAVCTFSVATNRQWTTDQGEKKEDAEFHRVVAWNKLAEICANLLKKGRKVYVEGRLQTRNWQTQDGQPRQTTEVVISDMIILDSRGFEEVSSDVDVTSDVPEESAVETSEEVSEEKPKKNKETKNKEDKKEEEDLPEDDDIPF